MLKNLLGSLILISLALLSACGPDESSVAVRAKPLKIIRFGRGADSVRLDPQTISDGESVKVIINIFDTLVRFKDDSMEIEACLATSWKVLNGGQSFIFKLRSGVKFHDGTPFNAEAARYTLRRLKEKIDMPEKISGSPYSALYENISTIEVIDELTLSVELNGRDVTFLKNIAMFPASIVSPTAVQADKEAFKHKPIGTGPFKFSTWESNVKVVIEKNPEYWGAVPIIDKVIFERAKNDKTRVRNLLKGEFDIIDGIRPEDIPSLQANPNITVITQPGMNLCYLALNNRATNGTHILDVRRAIALAIDRDELNQLAYNQEATPAYSPIPPTIPGSIEIAEFKEYNLEKARKLLAQAGFPDGLKLNLYIPSDPRPYLPDAKSSALVLKKQLDMIGIEVEIIPNEWETHVQKTENAEHDMCLLGWSTDNGDPDNFVSTFYSKQNAVVGRALNVSFYENDDVEFLLVNARQKSDEQERIKMYKKIQELVGRDAPLIPLMHTTQLCAHNNRLKNFVLHPMEIKRFYKVDTE